MSDPEVQQFDAAIIARAFPDLTDQELEIFVHQANRTGLDPLARQLFPQKRFNRSQNREVMTIMTTIDGLRAVADRTNCYAPGQQTLFTEDDGNLVCATAFVKKFVQGEWHEVAGQAYWDEYVQTDRGGNVTSMWQKMKHVMLGKCAEAAALRRAFPQHLSGLYVVEEMMQADTPSTPTEGRVMVIEGRVMEIKDTEKARWWRVYNGDKEEVFKVYAPMEDIDTDPNLYELPQTSYVTLKVIKTGDKYELNQVVRCEMPATAEPEREAAAPEPEMPPTNKTVHQVAASIPGVQVGATGIQSTPKTAPAAPQSAPQATGEGRVPSGPLQPVESAPEAKGTPPKKPRGRPAAKKEPAPDWFEVDTVPSEVILKSRKQGENEQRYCVVKDYNGGAYFCWHSDWIEWFQRAHKAKAPVSFMVKPGQYPSIEEFKTFNGKPFLADPAEGSIPN